eukprot:TRINITY_DN4375_c0_g1_i1.p1 TRINITY_DN4375_c0_g1~~TRINITY_DN4375_c0_g1_i1.p1  ORF type:complete len:568 (-),score=70.62 TRINITY_DN4375_c0_g1_i1:28-1656(-)
MEFKRDVFTCDAPYDADFTSSLDGGQTISLVIAYSSQIPNSDTTFSKHEFAAALNVTLDWPTDIVPPDCGTYFHQTNTTPTLQPVNWDSFSNHVDLAAGYTLYWKFEDAAVNGIVHIGIKTAISGWIGFGISPLGQMRQSDVVVAWIDSAGIPHFADRYASAYSRPGTDEQQGGHSDYFDIKLWDEEESAPTPPIPEDDGWSQGQIIALASAGVIVVVLAGMAFDWWVTSHRKYVDLDGEKAQPNPCGLSRKGLRFVFGGIAIVVGIGIVVAIVLSLDKDIDYVAIKAAIRETLPADYDDGSLAPLYLRLAWHASGTYSASSKNGGSCTGATMRYPPESTDGANTGLALARSSLKKVKDTYPAVSYADLWQLAAIVAVEEMGGPAIPFTSGREDAPDCTGCSSWVGRLPDGNLDASHVRDVFDRMGFTERETVALIGAHTVGHLHWNNSGWQGPWTWNPLRFDNSFFKLLRGVNWTRVDQSNGQTAFKDPTDTLVMIPTDVALLTDVTFRTYVDEFADDESEFFVAFSAAFQKLANLGCPGK